MTRTLTLNHKNHTYKIKVRTAKIDSTLVVWLNGSALTWKYASNEITNKSAKIMAERMIEEYYEYIKETNQ